MRDLSGVAALVTGAASGLGLATARALAAAGARVAGLDLSEAAAREAAAAWGGIGLACDVADEASVAGALARAEAAHGIARIAVSCAGVPGSMRLVGREGPMAMERAARAVAVNLLGTLCVTARAAHRMMAAEPLPPDGERGVIVNTASVAAFEGQVGQAVYAATKGAVAALTLPAAREFAPRGIRVLAIAPGLFRTPMAGDVPEAAREAILADAVFPARMGEPEDFADLVLAAIRNPMLNGEVIRLDAGLRPRAR